MYWSWSPGNFRIGSSQEKQNGYLQSGRSREVVVMRDNSNTSVTHFNVLYVIKCTLHIETRPDQKCEYRSEYLVSFACRNMLQVCFYLFTPKEYEYLIKWEGWALDH